MTDQVPAPNLAFASSWRRIRLTADERVARGKEARQRAPRSSHRHLDAPAQDRDPVAMLQSQAETRVPGLVPIRYGRMLASPFTFYRGAALLMAADLEASARSGITVQLCGDAHLSNFGLFATPERKLIFDINDFDETLPGPWEWDVKRLAASFEVMGRFRGFSTATRRDVVLEAVRAYRERMADAAARRTLDVWYDHLEAGELLDQIAVAVKGGQLARKDARAMHAVVRKARTRDSLRVFTKRVGTVDGELRIVADPPLIIPIEEFIAEGSADWRVIDVRIKELLASYRGTLGIEHHPLEEFRYVHAAHKIVGVGSVGTRCYIVLLIGRDNADPLILQVKEAQASVLERFLAPSEYAHHGQRVVAGQRLMQAASDAFLGWQRFAGSDGVERDYYVRQLHDWKGSADPEALSVRGATLYARICGATLARAHARWGDRIAIASYLGRSDVFDRAIADFSAAYADRNERDFELLERAVRSGRVHATPGL
ncbi:MAG TPA: DUF2252 domain-containing protein [Acidimicrobiales bacterium]